MMYEALLEFDLRGTEWTYDDAARRASVAQTREMTRVVHALGWNPSGLPSHVTIDQRKIAPSDKWFEHLCTKTKHDADAWWADEISTMGLNLGMYNVGFRNVRARFSPRSLVDGFATVPFLTGALGHVFYMYKEDPPDGFYKAGNLPGHGRTGLGLVFRGDGHLVLVSRRWITHGGPWRALTGANDTTLVQLYDLGAKTPDAAWSQAKASYPRFDATYDGTTGVVWFRETPDDVLPKDATYDAATKTRWVLAGDRNVPLDEMRDVAEDRFNGAVKPASMWPPVAASAYVFSSEERAKQHLHELWLRGHQVWFERSGQRTRIDDKYDPKPPAPPAWIAEAEARESKPDAPVPTSTGAKGRGDELEEDEAESDPDEGGPTSGSFG